MPHIFVNVSVFHVFKFNLFVKIKLNDNNYNVH